MANDKTDETDLVDASQMPEEDVTEARKKVVAEEAIEESATDQDAEQPFVMQMDSGKPGQATVASLRERLAAFLVDAGILWLAFWGALFVFNKLMTRIWLGPVPTMGYNALLFHGIFFFIAFLYFFLLEAAFFATIGKFCCWMYVRCKDGRHASALAIFIRNFFRLIELASAWLLTWVPMELSARHQRLGDMAAGTIVIKKHAADARFYPLDAALLASAFGRQLALVIDLALAAIWVAGYVLLINYQSLILSQWMVIAFPVVTVLFWTLVQVILETTPGLWIFGYTVTHEDGGRLTFAGALLRVVTAPIDLILGLPCMLLSLRKQKLGDMLAATVVSRQRRRWKGAVGTLVVLAVSVGLVALGLFANPVNNVFRAKNDFMLSFMPLVEGLPGWESASKAQPPVITLRNFRFGVGDPNTLRTPPVYEPGETVYLLFEIYGYTREDRMIWLQEDLMVQSPDGSVVLKRENALEYHQIIKPGGGPIEFATPSALPPTSVPGTYVMTVTVRDVLANNFSVTETQSFTVKSPVPLTSPLEAPTTPPPPPPSPLPVDTYGTAPVPVAPASTGPGAESTPAPVVPSSPIPVTPSAPSTVPGAPAQSPIPAPAAPPAGGFTVLPGPSLAPKEETVAPIPIVKSVPTDSVAAPVPAVAPATKTVPSDTYGTVPPSPPADTYAKPTVAVPVAPPAPVVAMPKAPLQVTPAPTPTPPVAVPPPTPPAIVEKTLPSEKAVTPKTTPAPADAYAQPVAPPPAKPAAKAPTDPYAKPAAKPAVAPVKKATPAPSPQKTEIQKAAEQELKKATAKPAAEIPSAESVKKTEAQPPPKKKKKSSGGSGVPSGGVMP